MNLIEDGLCFDDVLLKPKYSEIKSRSKVDTSVVIKNFKFDHPIIPANMKTITGMDLAIESNRLGGLSILHRFMPIQEQFDIAEDMVNEFGAWDKFGVSVGVKQEDKENILHFAKLGIKIICIDIAHGDSSQCLNMIKWIKSNVPNIFIIAGNVATGSGAENLWKAGADVVKVGIGPGSLCSTRIETGNGVPQLTALMDVYETSKQLERFHNYELKFPFIADGGLKNSGDITKALCFADMVMTGNIFAGCDETPGDTNYIDGKLYKEYVGSSTHKSNYIEGVSAIVPCKGKFENILSKLLEGLRSGMSYQGAGNLYDLKVNPQFIRITNAGLKESHPHDVQIIK